jgi:hypothetical protein
MSHRLLCVALVAALLLSHHTASAAKGGTKRRGDRDAEEPEQNLDDDYTFHDGGGGGGGEEKQYGGTGAELDVMNREEKIAVYHGDLERLRRADLEPALTNWMAKRQRYVTAKGNQPWLPSASQKEMLNGIHREMRGAEGALARVQKEETALVARLKPLYGLVSAEFVAEQRHSIASSLKKVNDIAYNQAWYESLFTMGSRESLQDVIVGFFVKWLMSYVIMYPFAVGYYALWVLPWSIWEYASGASDVATGAFMYLMWVGFMMLPVLGFYVCVRLFAKYGAPYLARQAEARRRQAQRRNEQWQ